MEQNENIELNTALAILDRGVRYELGEEQITIRPLKYGTVLLICSRLCDAGLTLQKIEEGEKNLPTFHNEFAPVMMECIAIAEINDKSVLNDSKQIEERVEFYTWGLNALQVYELFVYILNLSGIEAFTTTIRLALTLKKINLSPRIQGS